ncbi:MAG TPA: hypothetical protein VKX17_12835 [Planctomycetota bacterium]|nr:hypothetical protein [Planctomycetota bacterium]
MPSWASTYKKHASEGFEIVGLECQNSTDAEIADFMKSKSAAFEASTGGNLSGAAVSGIPHGFLFGADGKLIADDGLRGGALEQKVTAAVKECGAAMAGPGPYVKLAPLAAQIRARIGLGNVLKTLAVKKNSKDSAEAAEATMMYDSLHGSGQEQLENAAEKKSEDVLAAVSTYERLSVQFSGDEIGKKAFDELTAMKKDSQIRKEIEGASMWKIIEQINDKMKPVKGLKDPKDPAFVKLNYDTLVMLANGCKTIIARCPNTMAAKKAQDMIDEYTKPNVTAK